MEKNLKNLRRHKRFSATAFLNMPIHISPMLPYFGHPVVGKLIDLSANGLSMLVNEMLPKGTKLDLNLTFPGNFKIDTLVEIKRAEVRGKDYLVGIEFLTLANNIAEKIDFMSADYVDCESRIQRDENEICRTDCAFYAMCTKLERIDAVLDPNVYLEMAFKNLHASTV